MNKSYTLTDFTLDSFMHGTIEKFFYDKNKKFFQVIFSYLNLESGGCLFECTITITDWWDVKTSFTAGGKELDINMLQNFILTNPIDSAIYEYLINGDAIVFNGHVSDCLFSLEFIKPKIHITGEYDPD